ncbi:MAG: hypothetical protein JW944_02560 [Deltaproteobacteria bacterium]|nr:hypothetical protein [Deltaproteobacteria bacterium]
MARDKSIAISASTLQWRQVMMLPVALLNMAFEKTSFQVMEYAMDLLNEFDCSQEKGHKIIR